MALVQKISDDFNRANEAPISSPWSQLGSEIQHNLYSNGIRSSLYLNNAYSVHDGGGVSWDADQYCQLGTSGTDTLVYGYGIYCRVDKANGYYYLAQVLNNNTDSTRLLRLNKRTSSGFSQIGSDYSLTGLGAGKTVRLECIGSSIKAYYDGTLRINQTDSSVTTANDGPVYIYSQTISDGGLCDNFEAGQEETAPAPPANPSATGGNAQVTVTWDASAGATSYNLYWSTSSPVTTGDNKIAGVTSPYVHTGRTNGTTYYYAVTAENAAGESALSAEVNATPQLFALGLVASESETVGVWRIDRWQLGTPKATAQLRDLKSIVKTDLPLNVFTRDDYPRADPDIIGQSIPVGLGPLKGCKAYLINQQTKTFKVFDCPVTSFDGFYTSEAETFIPDTIDLTNGEFTWLAHDDEELLVDATLPDDNPVDQVKTLLTDTSTRGASVPLTDLDTTSTGKGFGAAGARVHHIRGTIPTQNNKEVPTYKVGLYINSPKDVFKWIQDVLVSAFLILYIDRSGKYQIKAWRPGRRGDATEILEEQIIPGSVRPTVTAADPVTRARVRYSINPGLDTAQVVEHSDDELRQLRGLPEHALAERSLPLAERFGAILWAQRAVAMRGVPRRTLALQVTQEHSKLEPGDYVGVTYSPLNIDSVWEVVNVTIRPGSALVDLLLIDSRGFGDGAGWWTDTAGTFNFPADLGGGAISAWSSGWTDAQKKWYRENWGVWVDDDGYADAANDPFWSYRGSRWT